MAYYGSRLSFGHHRNLSSVTIPNNVLVGEDGDFSGRFSVMMNYAYNYRNVYNSESGKYEQVPGDTLYEDDFKKNPFSSGGSYNYSFSSNWSVTPKLVFDNCPPLKRINIGGGYSINLLV